MKIKITTGAGGVEFPYGRFTKENRQFIEEHVGEIFSAKQHNMNYYVLENGMFVHVYNAFELDQDIREQVANEPTPPLFCQYFLTAGVDGKAILKGERLYSNFHQRFFDAIGVYVDCDGDVYVYFDGGNVKLTSIIREEAAMKLFAIPASEHSVEAASDPA